MSALVIDVRPARLSDAGALSDVHYAAWREAYQGIIPSLVLERMVRRRGAPWWRDIMKRRAILVLEVGGDVVGYASYGPAVNEQRRSAAEIQEIYLAPEYQGIGLGSRLFSAVVKTVRAKAYTSLLVRALAENQRAIEFYERRGGKLMARSDERLGGHELACIWFEFALTR
jgi:GNAT superfamily N-acetyltransferase